MAVQEGRPPRGTALPHALSAEPRQARVGATHCAPETLQIKSQREPLPFPPSRSPTVTPRVALRARGPPQARFLAGLASVAPGPKRDRPQAPARRV